MDIMGLRVEGSVFIVGILGSVGRGRFHDVYKRSKWNNTDV